MKIMFGCFGELSMLQEVTKSSEIRKITVEYRFIKFPFKKRKYISKYKKLK